MIISLLPIVGIHFQCTVHYNVVEVQCMLFESCRPGVEGGKVSPLAGPMVAMVSN